MAFAHFAAEKNGNHRRYKANGRFGVGKSRFRYRKDPVTNRYQATTTGQGMSLNPGNHGLGAAVKSLVQVGQALGVLALLCFGPGLHGLQRFQISTRTKNITARCQNQGTDFNVLHGIADRLVQGLNHGRIQSVFFVGTVQRDGRHPVLNLVFDHGHKSRAWAGGPRTNQPSERPLSCIAATIQCVGFPDENRSKPPRQVIGLRSTRPWLLGAKQGAPPVHRVSIEQARKLGGYDEPADSQKVPSAKFPIGRPGKSPDFDESKPRPAWMGCCDGPLLCRGPDRSMFAGTFP